MSDGGDQIVFQLAKSPEPSYVLKDDGGADDPRSRLVHRNGTRQKISLAFGGACPKGFVESFRGVSSFAAQHVSAHAIQHFPNRRIHVALRVLGTKFRAEAE